MEYWNCGKGQPTEFEKELLPNPQEQLKAKNAPETRS